MPTTDTLIKWDQTGEKIYETGLDRGVLYVQEKGKYPKGVAWNGLTAFSESPSGAEPTALFADNTKYLNLMSAEEFGGTIEAYTYPDEFEECDGSKAVLPGVTIGQQTRKPFGFAYRTLVGNDIEGTDFGYKLHLIYNALASPSEKARATVNDSPEAITFSYEIATTGIEVPGYKPTATLVIDSTMTDKDKMNDLEAILYGTPGVDADPGNSVEAVEPVEGRLPLPEEVIELLK